MRTNVYIDGFNLYYGCVKNSPYRWLDLHKLCRFLLPEHQINRIRYFTARIQQRRDDPTKHIRQETYLRALRTIPNLSIHLGQFRSHVVQRPLASPPSQGPRVVDVIDTKEKGSDVNLATYLLIDAFDQDYELAVVVSNDADLREPIRLVRERFDLAVGVLNPHQNEIRALRDVATFYRPIRARALAACLFPDELQDRRGTIRKPRGW